MFIYVVCKVHIIGSHCSCLETPPKQKRNYSLVLSMPWPVKIILGERGLREGRWKSGKRGLGTRGYPGRVEPWWSRCKNRLGLVTDGRRSNKARGRGVRRRVGLWWRWVEGGRWVYWRSRCRRWRCLDMSGWVLCSGSVRPVAKRGTQNIVRLTYDTFNRWNQIVSETGAYLSQCLPLLGWWGRIWWPNRADRQIVSYWISVLQAHLVSLNNLN